VTVSVLVGIGEGERVVMAGCGLKRSYLDLAACRQLAGFLRVAADRPEELIEAQPILPILLRPQHTVPDNRGYGLLGLLGGQGDGQDGGGQSRAQPTAKTSERPKVVCDCQPP